MPQANEKYYDLGGALGFVSTTVLSLYYPSFKAKFWDGASGVVIPKLTTFAPRQLLLTAALGAWSVRLGSFLAAVSQYLHAARLQVIHAHSDIPFGILVIREP